MGLRLLDVTVIPMKKFLALAVTIGAGIGGFLWWKRQQVIAANNVSADPWPSAVLPIQTPAVEPPTEIVAPVTDPEENKPSPKKSAPRKKVAKKATQPAD